MKTDHPILFSAPMVRAILAGRKTETRRVLNPQPVNPQGPNFDGLWSDTIDPVTRYFACPYGHPGHRLWVKETWKPHCAGPISTEHPLGTCVKYMADDACIKPTTWTPEQGAWCEAHENETRWRPSIHMPRWASRLTLDITQIRVERLQNICAHDAYAEGIDIDLAGKSPAELHKPILDAFRTLWDSINSTRDTGQYAWDKNPWVWVITFAVHQPSNN